MKLVHWLFVVSVLLFVTGIGFVIAGARSARGAPAPIADVQIAARCHRQADHGRHRRTRCRRGVRLGEHDRR